MPLFRDLAGFFCESSNKKLPKARFCAILSGNHYQWVMELIFRMKNIFSQVKDFLLKIINAQLSCRSWVILVIFTPMAVLAFTALLVFTVDPHYRYREPFFYDKVYYEVYAIAPSLLRNENYDTLMLGSSMVRNMRLSEIQNTFSGNPLKLAAAGGTMTDLKKFFDLALKTKKNELKQVIISLDIYALNKGKDQAHYTEYGYMYNDGFSEEYRYFFSRQSLSNILYLIKRKHRPHRHRRYQTDRDLMFVNDYPGKPYGLDEVVMEAAANEISKHTPTPFHPENSSRSLNEELLPMIDRNPQIKFTLFLPPYHVFCWCLSERFAQADALLKQRTMVIKELLKRPNVTIHDLQSCREIVCDHSLYNDTQHFSLSAGSLILEKIRSGKFIISTPEEAESGELELRKLITSYLPLYTGKVEMLKQRR